MFTKRVRFSTSFRYVFSLLSVIRPPDAACVVRKLNNGFGVKSSYTVVCVWEVQLTQNAALGCSDVKDNLLD